MFPLAHFYAGTARRAGTRQLHAAPDAKLRGAHHPVYDPADPFLAVALIVVFYVSQPNVLMIKLVSVVFLSPSPWRSAACC